MKIEVKSHDKTAIGALCAPFGSCGPNVVAALAAVAGRLRRRQPATAEDAAALAAALVSDGDGDQCATMEWGPSRVAVIPPTSQPIIEVTPRSVSLDCGLVWEDYGAGEDRQAGRGRIAQVLRHMPPAARWEIWGSEGRPGGFFFVRRSDDYASNDEVAAAIDAEREMCEAARDALRARRP